MSKTQIINLSLKLLKEWSVLKEVFKIPKRERIEQMKEHEREADRRYRAGLGLEVDNLHENKAESRYRNIQRHRYIEKIDTSDRIKRQLRPDDRFDTLTHK